MAKRRLHRVTRCARSDYTWQRELSSGSCYTFADPKSCWPLSTEFKNSESDVGGRDRCISTHLSIPLSWAWDIYFVGTADTYGGSWVLPVNRPCKIIVLTPPSLPSNSDAPMKNRVCRIGAPPHVRLHLGFCSPPSPLNVLSIQSSLSTYFHWFRWVHVISVLFID